jgi:hypothetical protein
VSGRARISAIALVLGIVVVAVTGCDDHHTFVSKRAVPTKRAYTPTDVRRAFAAEGLRLSGLPGPRYGGVIWLFAKEAKFFSDVSIGVHPAKDATRPLGLRLQLSTQDQLVRIRNVVISYASTSPSAAKVNAALTRLRRGSSAHRNYSAERFKACLVARHVDVTLTKDANSGSTAALIWRTAFAEWVYFFRTPEAATAERAKLKSSPARTHRALFRLFRTQRSNVLIFAPARKDWFSPIGRCLRRARA